MSKLIKIEKFEFTLLVRKINGRETVQRTILEGGRVCIINMFRIKSSHEKSCNYIYYCLMLAFFSYDDILGNYKNWAWRNFQVGSLPPSEEIYKSTVYIFCKLMLFSLKINQTK